MAVTTTGHVKAPAHPRGGQPVLEVRGLTKTFGSGPQTVRAVNGLDLTVRAGEAVPLLGPNGAGKTTTFKMSAGLVTPTAGHVHIAGADVQTRRGAAVRHLGAVLEHGRNAAVDGPDWRNAQGEVDRDEYVQRRNDLVGGRASHGGNDCSCSTQRGGRA